MVAVMNGIGRDGRIGKNGRFMNGIGRDGRIGTNGQVMNGIGEGVDGERVLGG